MNLLTGRNKGISVAELSHDDGRRRLSRNSTEREAARLPVHRDDHRRSWSSSSAACSSGAACARSAGGDADAVRGRRRHSASEPGCRDSRAAGGRAAGRLRRTPDSRLQRRRRPQLKRLTAPAAGGRSRAAPRQEAARARAATPPATRAPEPAAGADSRGSDCSSPAPCRSIRAGVPPRPAGTLGRPGACAQDRDASIATARAKLASKGYPAFLVSPVAGVAAAIYKRADRAVHAIAAKPSRSRAASRRKNSSSPGYNGASAPLGRVARAELPEVRPSRVRLDRARTAHRRASARAWPCVAHSSSASSPGAVYFAGTLYGWSRR